MITVAIADDHDIVRTGLKYILDTDPEINVVGEASDGASAIMVSSKVKPDILMLDLSMPPFQSGLSAITEATSKIPDTKIIVFTMFSDVDYLRYAMNNSAWGYIVKNASAEEILQGIHKVSSGIRYIHPSMAKFMDSNHDTFDALDEEDLTAREMELLSLLAMGHTNREISDKLYLSVKTIEAHRAKLYAKLKFDSRADLVAYALKRGLLKETNRN